MTDLYDTDITLWSEQQARLLRRHAAGKPVNDDDLDWHNIAEEIESLAKSDRREIRNRLAVICTHLLKWHVQSEGKGGGWRGSIIEARDQIDDVIGESPSLAPYPAAQLARVYARGRRRAEAETGRTDLPAACPWTIEQVMDPAFWPD